MGEQSIPDFKDRVAVQEPLVKNPSSEIKYQLLGYRALSDLKADPTDFLMTAEKDDLLKSDNPLASRVLDANNYNRSKQGSQSNWGLEDNFWTLMGSAASKGDFEDFERSYMQWLDKRFVNSNSNLLPESAQDALAKLYEKNPPLYVKLIQTSLDIRQQRIGKQWKQDEYTTDFFERSLEDWAQKEPLLCMSFVLENNEKISELSQSLVLKEVFKADREYGWSIAERFLHSPKISHRVAAYRLIEQATLQALENRQIPDRFINLFETTLDSFLSSDVVDENDSALNGYFDYRILENEMHIYMAACESSGIQMHPKLRGIEQKVFDRNDYKSRWLQQRVFDENSAAAEILLITERYDIYFAKDRPTSLFTPEGSHRLYRIGKCLTQERSKDFPNQALISQLTEDARRIVEAGFSDPKVLHKPLMIKIKDAVDSRDNNKIATSLYGFNADSLFTEIDPMIGAEAISKFIELNIVPRHFVVEHFERNLDLVLKFDPVLYLQLTDGITQYSSDRLRDRFELNRANALWRVKYQQDFNSAWEEARNVLTSGGTWTDTAGVIQTLDIVFAHQPLEAFDIVNNLVKNKNVWLKSRYDYETNHSKKSQEVKESDVDYLVSTLFKESIEEASTYLPENERLNFILKIYELGITEQFLRFFSPDRALGDLSLELKKELVQKLHVLEHKKYYRSSGGIVNDSETEIKTNTQSILKAIVEEDPQFVLDFISIHKMPAKLSYRDTLNELIFRSLSKLPTTNEVRNFDSTFVSLIEKFGLGNHERYVSLVTAYSNRNAESLILSYERIRSSLRSINEHLDENKKTTSTEQFVSDNQERIAKLILLYPNPVYALSLITEISKQHGFQRLQTKLDLLDLVPLEDTVLLHASLAKRHPSHMNQGLLGDLLGLYSAYQAINAQSKFFETLDMNVNSPSLTQEMSQKLMTEFSLNIGIDPAQLPPGSLDVWNFDYMPKLFEAAARFNDLDKTIYTLIVKATMLGDFESVINPDGQVDLSKYTEGEQILIDEIRNHNKLTRERFEKRNISLDAFRNGAKERRIKGLVTGEQIVTRTFNKMLHQIEQTFNEASGLVDITSLEKDRLRAIDTLTSSVDSLLAYLGELKRKETAQNNDPSTILTVWEHVIKTTLGSGKTAEGAILGEDAAIRIRSGNFLRAFSWKDGKLAALTPDASAIAHRIRILNEELDKAVTLYPDRIDSINQARNQLAILQTQLPKSSKAPSNKSRRPSLKDNTIAMTEVMDRAIGIVDSKIAHPEDHPETLDALKMLRDHLTSRKSDLEKFVNIAQDAKDTSYDLTLRRWKRSPGHDVFQGNYSSCCVAIDSSNGFAMLRYLTGHDIEMTEVIDTNSHESLGQTFEFISESRNGALSYTIDNCELATRITVVSDEIRNNLFEMAQETAESMKIDSDKHGISDVVMGSFYNDVDIDHLPITTKRIRKLSGPSFGLKQYLDVFVDHRATSAVRVLHPNTYHALPVAEVAKIEDFIPVEQPEIHIETQLAAARDWPQIAHDILRLEKDTFSVTADTPEVLQREFLNENNIAIIARDESQRVIGYTLGLNLGVQAIEGESGKVLYITSSVVDYDISSSGINSKMQTMLQAEASRRGFDYISRNTMADNGYAQRVIRSAKANGTLVIPTSLDDIQYSNYFDRPQIYIVTRVQSPTS